MEELTIIEQSVLELNSESSRNLGIEALYLVATLPEDERTQEQTNESCKIEAILLYALLPPYPRKNEQQA